MRCVSYEIRILFLTNQNFMECHKGSLSAVFSMVFLLGCGWWWFSGDVYTMVSSQTIIFKNIRVFLVGHPLSAIPNVWIVWAKYMLWLQGRFFTLAHWRSFWVIQMWKEWSPGDSSRDLWIPDRWRSPIQRSSWDPVFLSSKTRAPAELAGSNDMFSSTSMEDECQMAKHTVDGWNLAPPGMVLKPYK